MNTQRNIEERLWEFIDGHSSLEEKTVIERLLQTDTEWKAKYSELLEVNEMLQSSELEAPSMRFTKNVMEDIAKMHIAPSQAVSSTVPFGCNSPPTLWAFPCTP